MEKTKEYSEAVAEALEILQMSKEEIINKIPLEVIQQMNKNKSKTYKSKFDVTKPINEADLSAKTKAILAFLYRDYICPEEERAEINKMLYENEQEATVENLNAKEKESQENSSKTEDTEEKENEINNEEKTKENNDLKKEEEIKIEVESKNTEFVNVLPAAPKKKNFFKRMIESFFFYDDEA